MPEVLSDTQIDTLIDQVIHRIKGKVATAAVPSPTVTPVDAGSTAVFSVPGDGGREAVVAVLATRPAVTDTDGLRCSVATAVRQSFGFTLDDIVLVRRGTIPRTGSGKVQRFKVRERYLKDLTS